VDTLAARLHCGEAAAEQAAAQAWLQWEHDLMDLEANDPVPDLRQSAQRPARDVAPALAAARIGVHFTQQHFFLDEGHLLRHAQRLRGVPGTIVQGSRDLVTPPAAAAALHRAWPGSRLVQLDAAGHASRHPAMAQALIAATDAYRDLSAPTTARATPTPPSA
jgi:proline iminopeptidase